MTATGAPLVPDLRVRSRGIEESRPPQLCRMRPFRVFPSSYNRSREEAVAEGGLHTTHRHYYQRTIIRGGGRTVDGIALESLKTA